MNGARLTFIGAYQNAVNGLDVRLRRVLRAELVEAVGRRRLERPVAWPFSIAVICASTVSPNDCVIWSGYPSGMRVLRPHLEVRVALHHELLVRVVRREVVRARLPGIGFVPASFGGELAGRIDACGTASLYLNSGSGAVRLIVTVFFAALPLTPPASVQVAGVFRHFDAPTMPV